MEKEVIIRRVQDVEQGFPNYTSFICDYKRAKEFCRAAVEKIKIDDFSGAVDALYEVMDELEADAMMDRSGSTFYKTRPIVEIIDILSKQS